MVTSTEDALAHGRAAPTDADILPVIAARWSPRAFDDRPVEAGKLRAVFEAARWAPSCFNEQPWRFLVATRDEPEWLARLQGYLTESNRSWAGRAPVLVASAYRTRFSVDESPNRVALRDLGAAEENVFLQAYAEGLVMHQMAGFDHARLKEELLPEGFEPGVMFALGYPGALEDLPEKYREREGRPRVRKPLDEVVFGSRWGEPAGL